MRVLEILPDTKTHRERKVVAGWDDKYTVSIRKTDGRWVCSCKHFIFRCNKAGIDCKHITDIKHTYGNHITEENILKQLRELRDSPKMNAQIQILSEWSRIKDQVEMLHLYCTFTPGKEEQAKEISDSILKIKQGVM